MDPGATHQQILYKKATMWTQRTPLRRNYTNHIYNALTLSGVDDVEQTNGNITKLPVEIIALIFSWILLDSRGAPTLPRLNFLYSLRIISTFLRANPVIFSSNAFDAHNILIHTTPTQRFKLNTHGRGHMLELRINTTSKFTVKDLQPSKFSLLIFRHVPKQSEFESSLGKLKLCIVESTGCSGWNLAFELDLKQSMQVLSGYQVKGSV